MAKVETKGTLFNLPVYLKDYLATMAEFQTKATGKRVTKTDYLISLLEADYKKNKESFDKLQVMRQQMDELMKELAGEKKI